MRTLTLTLAAVLTLAGLSCGKSDESARTAPATTPAMAATRPAGFQPGDTVEVRIPGLSETGVVSDSFPRVQGDGAIAVPLLADPIVIVGTDPAEAARRVADAYRKANILSTATVSVRRIDYPTVVADVVSRVGPPTTHPSCYDPGDLLEVSINGLSTEQPTQAVAFPVRVQGDGTIRVPLVADLNVGGKDAAGVAKVVADAFRAANIMSNAQITVRRLQVAGTGGPMPGPIAPFDLIRCAVFGMAPGESPVTVARVDSHGNVRVPLIPPLHVAGLTDGAASTALAEAYRKANLIAGGFGSVLLLERAPPDAAHRALPDEPILPVPEPLRHLYESR